LTLGAIHIAHEGILEQRRRFERAAGQMVAATTTAPADASAATDPARATGELLRARQGLDACLAVAQAAEQTLGRFIDTLA